MPRDLAEVRREHVTEDEQGVLVEVVAGPAVRTVPILAEWEDYAMVLAECVEPGAYVFKAERNKPQPQHIGWTIGHSKSRPPFGVNLQQMRLTWYVTLLNRGCPVQVLVEAAGLEGLGAIERVVPFLDEVPARAARTALRAWHKERQDRYRQGADREYVNFLNRERRRREREREAITRQVKS